MTFADSQYLYFLLLVPLFFIIQWAVLKVRTNKLRRFGDLDLVKRLMPSYSVVKTWVRLVLFSIGFVFLVLSLARPRTPGALKEHKISGAEVMIVLDVSRSMLAQDYAPFRLQRAKQEVIRVVDKLQDERIGLIIFAGSSFVQLPVTADYLSAKMFMNSISTESIANQGTALGDAIRLATNSFTQESNSSRAIVVITDGENHEDNPVEAASYAVQNGARVYTIGVGSMDGTTIPLPEGGYLMDSEGNPVITKLDEKVLIEVAEAGDGIYIKSTNDQFGLEPIFEEIRNMKNEEYISYTVEDYDEHYAYFLSVALLFLAGAMLVGYRRIKWRLF